MEGNFEVPSRQFSSGMSIPITGKMEFGLAETHSMISVPPGMEGSSFTALLELPTLQVMDLLIEDEFPAKPIPPPRLPSDIALVDRSSRLSIYASVNNSPEPESTTILSASNSMKLDFVSSSPPVSNPSSKSRKRKVKEPNRKSKKVVTNEASEESGEKLPYVHVRARRGQATDSHSLAERARREKINARMKLLQELVPGCNKVSGTAIVLDEIINHVQALQRQVEFLSMRLAAVNPRVDFNLDALFVAENGSSMDSSYPGMFDPPVWPEGSINMNRQHQHHQTLHVDGLHQPSWATEEDTSNLVTQDHLLLGYDFRANSAPMEMDPNQLNMGL